jgi:hypothetical protein
MYAVRQTFAQLQALLAIIDTEMSLICWLSALPVNKQVSLAGSELFSNDSAATHTGGFPQQVNCLEICGDYLLTSAAMVRAVSEHI